MVLTDYHTQYFAYELTKRYASDSLEKLAGAVAGAQVDLNPHQVDAALFAFTSPLSKGALLADEVGLGKTIEAGLVIAQKWAERKRQILVITPANLRKQWQQELSEKFFLPCTILESHSYSQAIKQGNWRPFDSNATVIICSYQFARSKAADIHALPWDLVVIDEAHRLRNVYKSSNVIANTLKKVLADRHKLLLTATPLQNSLLELYGLVSFIDEHVFGDLKSFREQFANLSQAQSFQRLKERLQPLCHRTLRRQVLAYVPYTERHPLVEEFTPDEGEDRLYHLVSDYLQRPNLQALPAGQRSLMTLVLRKLLASSSFAIAGALTTIAQRLKAKVQKAEPVQTLADELAEEYEALDEIADEWDATDADEPLSAADRAALVAEIADLEEFTRLATSIDHNAKGKALLKALDVAFAKAAHLGAAQKAIIFTESRRTQSYLLRLLADSPYAEGIVLFNGNNSDADSKQIYNGWLERHAGTDRVTGSRTADMRSALVDYFREEGRIMIATEAGAEGINLQFCSLVVNYDLPWNPQRIEQRIGRCHRYGQKHDVVVVNFLNRKNEADKRVFELLAEKFQLFAGVFGASDEVLGAIESGVDFEKRIAEIYQRCRQPAEIKAAFDQLQAELSQEIDAAMTRTRQQLLENFDDEVREKLKVRDEASKAQLNHFEQRLLQLTRHELRQHAAFLPDGAFCLLTQPFPTAAVHSAPAIPPVIPLGRYELPRRSGDAHLYRLQHPLAEALIAQAKQRPLPPAAITFSYADHAGKVTILEPLLGQQGVLALTLLTVSALDQAEDHLLFAAVSDAGQPLDEEACRRLFSLPARVEQTLPALALPPDVTALTNAAQAALIQKISARNSQFFEAELKKLDAWADDQLAGAEKALKDIKKRIRDLRNEAGKASDLSAQATIQSDIGELERRQRKLRQEIFDVEDRIVAQRDALVAAVRGKLQQSIQPQTLFTIRWSLQGQG
ncbi:MAG: SNF2-related protein [Caldilineaceae bacterium]